MAESEADHHQPSQSLPTTVKDVVKDLPPELQESVCQRMTELGIQSDADIEFLKPETDFANLLTPIQARRMAAGIKDLFNVSGSTCNTLDVSSRDNSPLPNPSYVDILSDGSESASSRASNGPSSSSASPSPPLSQNWTNSFKIPYTKFPAELIEACENGRRPKNGLRREMIRILCAEISQWTRLPGKRNLETIAAQLVTKYPNSFTDLVGGEVLGTGHAGLVSQLLDRMANAYGRGKNPKRLVSSTEESSPHPSSSGKKKKKQADTYGCINFAPNTLPESETEESLNEKKKFLNEEHLKLPEERDLVREKRYMGLTYILQRKAINQELSMREIYTEWPLLFQPEFLLNHFKQLTGIDLVLHLRESLSNKAKRLLDFLGERRGKTKGVKEWLARIESAGGLSDDSLSLIIPVVAAALGEDPDQLIQIFEETTNASEVERKTKLLTPHIAAIGDVFDDATVFLLVVERQAVSRTRSVDEAMAITFASYYIFNLQYEQQLSSTLEFVQRCFVKLNPARGTKSRSKKTGIASNKVVSLLNSFQQFEWNLD